MSTKAKSKKKKAPVEKGKRQESDDEQKITQDWSHIVDKRYTDTTQLSLRHVNQQQLPEAWTVDEFLSDDECLTVIALAEKVGFGRGKYSPFRRNNLRLMLVSPQLSQRVWRERVQPLFAGETFQHCGKLWRAVGINSLWRFSKYNAGNFFKPHVDDYYRDAKSGQQSLLTVNIYLNDNAAATRFYFRDGKRQGIERVVPEAGRALVFRQAPGADYLHAGETVADGVKYLMRCDVMFEPVVDIVGATDIVVDRTKKDDEKNPI